MKYKLFSFFSGAGFLDLGFESEGYNVVYVNESHAPFLDAYKYSRQELKIEKPEHGYYESSITDFVRKQTLNTRLREMIANARRDGSLVGFIGGPPCPDFSIGGKNRGRDGDRGKLSETYIQLICRQKPDFFLFENVKGLWQTKLHRMFYEELKSRLKRAGYALTDRLTNSIEYGVPQDRDRIMLVGLRDPLLKKQLGNFPWLKFAEYPEGKAFEYAWPQTLPFQENSNIPQPADVPVGLTVEYWFQRNDVLNHPNTEHCFTPKAGIARFRTVPEGDDSKKSFKRLHRWRYSPTAAYGNNEVHLHPYKPRRISVAEALAIQSLPREFALPSEMTLSNMFKTIGNGVPYLAARMIARSIKMFLEELNESHSDRSRASDLTASAQSRLPLH